MGCSHAKESVDLHATGVTNTQGTASTSSGKSASSKSTKAGDKQKVKKSDSPEKKEARRLNQEYIDTLQTLSRVPLLRRLPRDQHPILAGCCVARNFKPGEEIITQGDIGHEFFVIKSGEASVIVQSDIGAMTVATVRAGDYFGENALLHDEPRNATIKAQTDMTTLMVTREKFQELGLHLRLEFAKRKAVCAASDRAPPRLKTMAPKTPEQTDFIIENLQRNNNLRTITEFNTKGVNQLASSAWLEEVAEGQKIIQQGDEKAEYFYIVQKGSFDVLVAETVVNPSGLSGRDDDDRYGTPSKVGTIPVGGSFGELALLYSVPRAATVQATEPSSVWVIDRANFKRMLLKASDDHISEYAKLLDGVEVFSTLLQDEKRAVAEALTEVRYQKGQVVITQGDEGDTFFILVEGEVEVFKDGESVTSYRARKEAKIAHHFGELALINNEPRAATVAVTSDTARILSLDKQSFQLLLGFVWDSLRDHDTSGSVSGEGKKNLHTVAPYLARNNNVMLEDLDLVNILGVGAFGKVELRKHKRTSKTYAVKMMSKGYICRVRMQHNVLNEKHILATVSSPFIIKLFGTGRSEQWLYFFLEPALGGELYVIYHRRGLHGSLPHALYYCAGVILAFEHLHERHVIYRDLKPENLLLTDSGQMKLTDMGLAKFVVGKTYTTCGTPEYFAPEVIRSIGQTRAVDWWTLGILMFELLTGGAPFKADSDMNMYSKVLKGIDTVEMPRTLTKESVDVIKSLLKSEPSERLPMRPGGSQNLKAHPFFKGLSWTDMMKGVIDPPYKPSVKSPTDTSNFAPPKTDKVHWVEWKDDGSGWDRDF